MKEEQKEETEGEKDEEEDEEDHGNSEDRHLHTESAEDTAVHDYTAQEASMTTIEDLSASAFQYDPIEWIEAVSVDYPRLDFKPIPLKACFLAITLVFFLGLLSFNRRGEILGHRPAGVFQLQTSQDQLAFPLRPRGCWDGYSDLVARHHKESRSAVSIDLDGCRERRTE